MQYTGSEPACIEPLGGAASNRRYYRLSAGKDGLKAIGVIGENAKENHAFLSLARHMRAQGLNVPAIYAVSEDEMRYVQEDLGSTSLYDLIVRQPDAETTHKALRQVMQALPRLQFLTHQGFDYARDAFREPRFCLTTVRWDLYYFKYCFVKLTGYQMDEIKLEEDFEQLQQALLDHSDGTCPWGFLYRDFQSRNVMMSDGQPWFIDFQGGYEGPVYYDVASFLWQTRANYSPAQREELVAAYVEALQEFCHVDLQEFWQHLYPFVYFRLLQTLGTYGYRGLFEHKTMFQTPIRQALRALLDLTPHMQQLCPYLCQLLEEVSQMERFIAQDAADGRLTVRITSFSYKRGIPEDYSGNGGGFVFDCRAPLNPGRFAYYKKLTGLDTEVIDFLEGRRDEEGQPKEAPAEGTSMQHFVEHMYALVDPAVQTYLERGFTSLTVNCGCTGGQHRSVYCAQHLADHLAARFPSAQIILTHREQQIKKKY